MSEPTEFQYFLIVIGVILLIFIAHLWQKVGCYQWRINTLIMFLIYLITGSIIYIKEESDKTLGEALLNVVTNVDENTEQIEFQAPLKGGKSGFIGERLIEGLENRKINSNNLLINNHIAGSYNSCFGIEPNIANIENLKWVLKAGFRVVDFEIYMETNNDPKKTTSVPGKIAVIGSSNMKLKNICPKTKKQPTMITEYPRGTVNVKQAFKNIAMYGFKGHKYSNLPLFINLRIKSPDARIYSLLADDVKELKQYLPDKTKYGYWGTNRTADLDKLKYTDIYSNELSRKVFIMVEDYCNNYEGGKSPFAPFINLAVGKNLQVYDSSYLGNGGDSAGYAISPQEQITDLSIIKPDNTNLFQNEQSQPHLENSKHNGINFMLWNVRCAKCIEPLSKTKNLGSRTIGKQEAQEEGIKETKGYGFFGFFEKNYVVRRKENLWKYEEKISPVIKTKVDPCDVTNKCVRQYFDRNKGKWIFNPPRCDKDDDKFPRVVQLPNEKEENGKVIKTECKVLDRKTMYKKP
tara:strand:- start:6191 stop:7750 length:1560 start_codon:yes stop_codon:yes gene_type:complete